MLESQAKNLGIILDLYVFFTAPFNQPISKSYLFCLQNISPYPSTLHHPHHYYPGSSHHHSHLGYGNSLLRESSLCFHPWLPQSLLNSHSVILLRHKSDQVSPPLKILQWLPSQTQSQSLSSGLPALVQWFPVNTVTSSSTILFPIYPASNELSSLLFLATPDTLLSQGLCMCYSSCPQIAWGAFSCFL